MKVIPVASFRPHKALAHTAVAVLLFTLSALASAQDGLSVEELEQMIEEQRIALQEAIANREATAAKVAEIEAELAESDERRQKVEAELETLCEKQESLDAGTFDNCMESVSN